MSRYKSLTMRFFTVVLVLQSLWITSHAALEKASYTGTDNPASQISVHLWLSPQRPTVGRSSGGPVVFRLFLLTPIAVLVTIGSPFWFFRQADTDANKAFYGKGMGYAKR